MKREKFENSEELKAYTENLVDTFIDVLHARRPFLEVDDEVAQKGIEEAMGNYVNKLVKGLEVLYEETKNEGK